MQDSVKVTQFLLLIAGGLIVLALGMPLVIGYGTAQLNTLGAVPNYFVNCHPGWTLVSWYEREKLFIPIDGFYRYLIKGCPEVEPRRKPGPEEYVSNSVFLFLQRNLDRWYFMGYRAGEDHAIETILPTWNWVFQRHAWVRKAFVVVLGLMAVGLLVGLGYGLSRILWHLSSVEQ